MADTRRTRSQLQTLLATNTTGDISAQDMRDVVASMRMRSGGPTLNDLVCDYGAVLNSSSQSDVDANNDAIAAAIADAAAGTASGFCFDGTIYFSDPIIFPETAGLRPYNFGIQGLSPNAKLVYVGDRTTHAIVVSTINTLFPNNQLGFELRHWLFDFCLINGSCYAYGGGKYLRMRDFNIAGGPTTGYALNLYELNGGQVQANVHDCTDGAGGIYMSGCTATQVDFVSRVNDGIGWKMEGCFDITGWINSESNLDLNADLYHVARCSMGLWFEGAFGLASSAAPFQAKRRDCFGNVWTGQTQGDNWDSDEISRISDRFLSAGPWNSFETLGVAAHTGTVTGSARVNLASGTQCVTSDNLTFTIKQNATNFSTGASQIYFRHADLAGVTYAIGDYGVISFDVSSPDWLYLKTFNSPLLFLGCNHSNASGGNIKKLDDVIRLSTGAVHHFVSEPFRFNSAGAGLNGSDGIYTYILVSETANSSQPTQDFTFTLANIKIRFIDNT